MAQLPPDALVSVEEFARLLKETMPSAEPFGFDVREMGPGRAVIALPFSDVHVRPGGTMSGPAMFTLADTALWAAVLSAIGLIPLAVTTDMTVHFLKRPPPAALIAEAQILRLGGTLIYGSIDIRSEGSDDVVCHAVGTYARPPEVRGPP